MDPEPTQLLIFLSSVNISLIIGVISICALLACSALISGAEVAFFSLTRSDIDNGLQQKSTAFQIISKLLERPKKLLATILVANNFINIATVLLFATISKTAFEGRNMIVEIFKIKLDLAFLFDVVVATFLILLFGEILPKIYANRNRIKFATFMAQPIKVLDVVFSPISLPMRSITLAIHSKLGKQKSNLSVDQLSQALELTSAHETTMEEHKILQGIVSFGNTDTKQVMRPRIDIFALSNDLKYSEIIPEVIKNGYSRIPVYKETIDNVVGILYVKDLLPYIDRKQFDWTALLRDPFFVPENKKLDDLMAEFQDKKVHLAMVVDEYGGTSGLVSLEDVIEEIVGDISDEFDDEDLIYTKIDDFNYSLDGKIPLKDFYKIINLADDSDFENHKGEAETVAGFVLEISGVFPRRNSKINFKDYVFTIEVLDKKRIKQVKFTILK